MTKPHAENNTNNTVKTITVNGIEYQKPTVILLQNSGLGVAEIAGRTCYDSFDKSENKCINDASNGEDLDIEAINNIEESQLLDSLAWVYHHHSSAMHKKSIEEFGDCIVSFIS